MPSWFIYHHIMIHIWYHILYIIYHTSYIIYRIWYHISYTVWYINNVYDIIYHTSYMWMVSYMYGTVWKSLINNAYLEPAGIERPHPRNKVLFKLYCSIIITASAVAPFAHCILTPDGSTTIGHRGRNVCLCFCGASTALLSAFVHDAAKMGNELMKCKRLRLRACMHSAVAVVKTAAQKRASRDICATAPKRDTMQSMNV